MAFSVARLWSYIVLESCTFERLAHCFNGHVEVLVSYSVKQLKIIIHSKVSIERDQKLDSWSMVEL